MPGAKDAAARKMSTIAMRALQKVLDNHHIPSFAAGDENYLTIVMGDCNVTAAAMQQAAQKPPLLKHMHRRSVRRPSVR